LPCIREIGRETKAGCIKIIEVKYALRGLLLHVV